MKTKLLLLTFSFLMTASILKADYLLGGDITWMCAGKDSFIITLTLYRDCNKSEMKDAHLQVRCKSSGELITTLLMPKPNPVDITPTCGDVKTRCQDTASTWPYGFEQYTFTKLLILNDTLSCCDLILSFSECCFSSDLTNIQSNSNFYLQAQLNRCLYPGDNSPRYTNPPIAIIGIGHDFIYSHGIFEIDVDSNGGLMDSLAAEITAPLTSADTPVAFISPYSYDKPVFFWGFPDKDMALPRGFHLDSTLGYVSFRPMKIEFPVLAVKITEYRRINGEMIKIGEQSRYICLAVYPFPNNNAPVLSGPFYKSVYAGDSVSFSVSTNDYDTKDSVLIYWDNSIPGATWTDNNHIAKHPTGTLTWRTKKTDARSLPYTFKVYARDDACPYVGKDTQAYEILIWDSTTIGIRKNTLNNNEIKIYPNPANDQLTIESSENVDKIILYNFLGAKIREMEVNGNKATLHRDKLPSGLYLLKVFDKKGEVYVYQVVFK